ncbi:MAG: preprotein translocase subunit SecE [Lachnospiraceae bacterium]|nr:preprotein translocase subunit SecE [Lachnospiraceae bacterium]
MAENNNEATKVKFFDGVKAEFKKISWPDRNSLGKQTAAVIVISVIVGALIAVLDMFFQYGFNFITSIGG